MTELMLYYSILHSESNVTGLDLKYSVPVFENMWGVEILFWTIMKTPSLNYSIQKQQHCWITWHEGNRKMKNSKAAESDGVYAELIKEETLRNKEKNISNRCDTFNITAVSSPTGNDKNKWWKKENNRLISHQTRSPSGLHTVALLI